ncbi:MAG: hypothetical protein WD673_00815 [Alphaproteobacteria bacterium]
MSFEFRGDAIIRSDDPSLEIIEAAPTIDAELDLRLADPLSIRASLIAESVFRSGPFQDRLVGDIGDIGAKAETLFVEYATGALTLYAGKINPPFGVGWDLTPGLYGTDFAEDYELTERIGFGGSVSLGGEGIGVHVLGASAFFLDTSVLSQSLIEDKGGVERSDGGPSNTGDPASFALTLDGGKLPGLPGLSYHAAISRQEGGRGAVADEAGYAFALHGEFPLGDGARLAPIVEIVRQVNDEAGPDDVTYVTAGVALLGGPWSLALSGTMRATDATGGPDTDDSLLQVSVGYAFGNGLSFELGYKATEVDSVDSDVVGALIAYEIEF